MLRFATRTYFRHAPWRFGRLKALSVYFKHLHPRPHRATVRTAFGERMDLETPDLVSGVIYLTGLWEPSITRFVSRSLAPGDTFIDVGANIGYYSLLASTIVGPHGKVVSIEASPGIHARLQRNVDLNGRGNIRTIHAAASNAPGELVMYRDAGTNAGHSTTVAEVATRDGMVVEARVTADTLENLVGPDLWQARFIKIDVEGAEPAVFGPLLDHLQSFARAEWLVELSPDMYAGGQVDVERIYGAFKRAGYRCYAIPNVYDNAFLLTTKWTFTLLETAPRETCDVVFSRRELQQV